MADTIKCPACGKSNPANQELCQYCQSRLQPASRTDSAIQPGQIPTKKNTAELEPILPQWLKDARDSARNAMPQVTPPDSQKPDQRPPAASSEDFLAGLSSHADDEEDETPDWLASITGAAPKPKKPSTESTETRRVELGGKVDFSQEESSGDSDTPSWLAGLTPKESQAEEKDELTDWFRSDNESSPVEKTEESSVFDDTFSTFSSADDTPDWLRQMAADEGAKKAPQPPSFDATTNEVPAESSETPDWLRQMAADSDVRLVEPSTPDLNPADDLDTPDWLRGLEDKAQSDESPIFSESDSGRSEPPALISTGELPAWLNDQAKDTKPLQDTTPKWLKKDVPASVTGELPAWLSSNEETMRLPASEEEDATPTQDESLGDLPDWLKAAAPQANLFEEPAKESTSEPADVSFDTNDSPDWLNTFKAAEEEPQFESTPAIEKETPFDVLPALNPDDQPGESVENLFAEMPDWLSNAMELPDTSSPTPITNTDAISPGELPSWVQAMRPVDAAISSLSSSPSFSGSSDQTLESRGALAGLQGVLPAVAGFTPTSKPKPYSIRLQASEEQQAHAELLEQILSAETAPVPIASFSSLRASRSLRWLLFAVVFAAVFFGLFSSTPIFSMPLGVPRETGRAVEISRALPQGAPVLVALDFEASHVGEMEAVAAPFFDQMIFYSHPDFKFISTSDMGSILAERFVAGPLAGHYANNGFTYSNLGYLPGGQLGIRAFAQNPRAIAPLDISLQPAWTSTPDNLTSLSQLFIAMILVTDNADAARAWIEQTENSRTGIPIIIISSAQAAPMIQPYFESQQVNGIVAGLYGGAVFEQNNAGTVKTARSYWDAYSLGMLLAMSLVLGGGLWNLALGLRDRASARETK